MSEVRLPIEIQITWLLGLTVSVISLICQALIYILIPCSRKLDQKLLTQLTIARILNVTFDYVVINIILSKSAICNVLFSILLQTDAALVCWMFIFTKNLYDKVIHAFVKETNFTITSVLVWTLTSPIGLTCPLLMYLDPNLLLCKGFSKIFTTVKAVVLTVNLFLFCRIFKEVITKKNKDKGVLKACVVSIMLLSISGAQTLAQICLKGIFPQYFGGQSHTEHWVVFGVINSYEVVAITMMFWILVDKNCENKLLQTIARKIFKETV